MPYIKKERRQELDPFIAALSSKIEEKNVGELNYVFTKILLAMKPKKYEDYNALVGVLESCKLEFYRRGAAEYEDVKIEENGDVYPVNPALRELVKNQLLTEIESLKSLAEEKQKEDVTEKIINQKSNLDKYHPHDNPWGNR